MLKTSAGVLVSGRSAEFTGGGTAAVRLARGNGRFQRPNGRQHLSRCYRNARNPASTFALTHSYGCLRGEGLKLAPLATPLALTATVMCQLQSSKLRCPEPDLERPQLTVIDRLAERVRRVRAGLC